MSTGILNLDQRAAEWAQNIVKEASSQDQIKALERLTNKALGVLREQGVYALMLFLFSRSGGEEKEGEEEKEGKEAAVAKIILQHLQQSLFSLPMFEKQKIDKENPNTVLRFYTENVLKDLDTLLLVRDLYEQILIYVRHGAKAAGG